MLTGLRLGNFKAFGETQHIPIKPLTLIFGANSAGKSSIIHGLLLGCHANKTGNLDVHQTELGGETVDLGGFRQYVHRRDISSPTTWGVQVDASQWEHKRLESISHMGYIDVTLTFGLTSINQNSSQPIKAVAVETYKVEAGNSTVLSLLRHPEGGILFLNALNQSSLGLLRMWDDATYNLELSEVQRAVIAEQMMEEATNEIIAQGSVSINSFLSTSCSFVYSTEKDPILLGHELIPDLRFSETSRSPQEFKRKSAFYGAKSTFKRIVDSLIWDLAHIVTREMNELQYLGPLRSYPGRHLAFPESETTNWFAGGGYAWETVRTDARVRDFVNSWLGNHLKTPYELLVRRYVAEDDGLDTIEELVLKDKRFNTLVSHRDIGVGISQVLPVLVSAYASEQQTIAIEQPEIHLHPALQAELGDVFIESALGERKNTFLLETHSEHLILRIMRRMRDTVRGTLPEGMPPVRPEDVAILYVDRKADDSTSVVMHLRLDEEGQLIDPWPHGFFEEGFNERFA